MLDPTLVTNAVVSALRTIPALVTAMGADPTRIIGYHYYYGLDNRLQKAVFELKPPSMLAAWTGTMGGNFDGQTIWKHRVEVYIRAGNVVGQGTPISYEAIWHIICNNPINSGTLNIRSVQLIPGLDIMDTPSIEHKMDEDLEDLFCGIFLIPEIGDN